MDKKWLCVHGNLSDADDEGYAICLDCGASVVKHLTREIFMKQIEALRKSDEFKRKGGEHA